MRPPFFGTWEPKPQDSAPMVKAPAATVWDSSSGTLKPAKPSVVVVSTRRRP